MHAHIIPNIIKISLKGVEMIFGPGSTNSIQGKDRKIGQNYQRIMFFYLQETQVRNYLVFKHSIKRFIDYQIFFYNYDYLKKNIFFYAVVLYGISW